MDISKIITHPFFLFILWISMNMIVPVFMKAIGVSVDGYLTAHIWANVLFLLYVFIPDLKEQLKN